MVRYCHLVNERRRAPNVNAYTHIYISPHLDDVVLSCGGRIGEQGQAGERVLVVTVFGGVPAPDTPLSPFAQELHARWGHACRKRVADAATRRQEEDTAALALLGADLAHWPYTDCIYRQTPGGRFPYASEEALWGEIHPTEKTLVAELAARLASLPLREGGAIYAPLAVGRHVDHKVARRAVEMSGHAPIYYEDFPYAQDPQKVQAAQAGRQWQAEVVMLSEEALEVKIAAISCYHSQLGTFWASPAEMAAGVRAFAARTGGGRPAERYWR
jgi:LmbE family N-acetylglucosaminyl deacetylase